MSINKKVKRTIMENSSQYIGSAVLIMISCIFFIMFNVLNINLEKSNSSFKKDYIQEDASFIVQKKIDNIAHLESKFNIIMEEGSTFDYDFSKDKTIRVFTQNNKVNLPAVIEGSQIKNDDEICLDPAFAKENKYKIGDNIKIYDKNFKIVGYMSLPNYIYPLKSETDMISNPKTFGIAVITKNSFKYFNKGYSFYSIKFRGSKDVNSELKNTLNESNKILRWTDNRENGRISYVDAKIDGIKKVSVAMPLAMLILTSILISVVMWRMVKKEFTVIGTLYALGYRKFEILKHYLLYPFTVSLVGSTVGTALGLLTVKPMIKYMVTFFNVPLASINYSPKYIILSFLLPLLFLTISSALVVNIGLRYSPLELMRGGRNKNKVNFIERNLKLNRSSFNTKFRIRELLRNIPRSVFLLLGIVFATMFLLYGFAAKSSIDYLMKDTFENVYMYEYDYMFNSLQKGSPNQGEAYSLAPFTKKDDEKLNIIIYGINENSKYISLKDKNGDKLSLEKTIVTKPLSEKLNLKEGDVIKIKGKFDAKEHTVKIDKIADTYIGDNIYMPINKFNTKFNLPQESYIGLWSDKKLDLPQEIVLKENTKSDSKKAFDSVIEPFKYVVSGMAFLAFLIGLIVIYVVTSLVIEENKQTISLFKVLGYKKKEIYSLILNSSTIFVLIGYVLGIPLLMISLDAMFKSVTKDINFSFPIIIDKMYLFVGFIIILLTYELSKRLSRRKIRKISMSESLKSRME
ncbi:ABC transporter permease [Haloimpatiens sp. FM7330]|uniref:ABC transporter permease n=1 Tax=Haloimpatiens sp. FM7330 TaxID=3298610 RepID=UPI003634A5F9